MCLSCACGLKDSAIVRPTSTTLVAAGPPLAAASAHPAPTAAPPGAPSVAVQRRRLVLGQRLLEHNERQAAANRSRFAAAGVVAVNLLSSPGSGKTALLETLARHRGAAAPALAALVGDLATDHDAIRLRQAGLAAVAISTGQICHLDAAMVARGVDALEASGHPLAHLDLLLIENVGNLVCPAAYDLGERRRLVLLAVGEGEDKPLKYPPLFHGADVVVISKVDLAGPVGFDRPRALANIRAVAPRAAIVEFSARTGAGLPQLLAQLAPAS